MMELKDQRILVVAPHTDDDTPHHAANPSLTLARSINSVLI